MRLLILCILFPLLSAGQNSFRANVNVKTGLGWWIYKQGVYTGDTTGYIGYRRSHASLALGYTLDMSYNFKKLNLGFQVTYGQFIDKTLFDSRYSIFNLVADTISTGIVSSIQPGLSVEYLIIKKQKFEWAPHVEFGYLGIKTTHPQKSNFGFQGFLNIGFMHRWWLNKNWGLSFLPIYNRALILPKKPAPKGERHDIFSFTAGFGVHYRIVNKQRRADVE